MDGRAYFRPTACAIGWLFVLASATSGSRSANAGEVHGLSTDAKTSQIEKTTDTLDSPDHEIGLPSPICSEKTLQVDELVALVLERSPTVAQMAAALAAAQARFPQAKSLDDPTLGFWAAPASATDKDLFFAYRLEAAQKLPFPGKRRIRGEAALAEASAAVEDLQDVKLQLVESTKAAYYDFYMVQQAISVNMENGRLLKELRDSAEARYRTGQTSQQDITLADVEIGRQEERTISLERARRVAMARINTLLFAPAESSLPSPPKKFERESSNLEVKTLTQEAIRNRPDLRAIAERLSADRSALGLARKEFFPDPEVMAAFDSFWQPQNSLYAQVGVRINLPVQLARRRGAVNEAMAKISQRTAEFNQRAADVGFQVKEAAEQVREGESILALYEKKVLPSAETNVQAAQAAYTTGRIPFLTLLESQRNLIGLRDRYYEATADYFRRRAALDRAVGAPLKQPEISSP